MASYITYAERHQSIGSCLYLSVSEGALLCMLEERGNVQSERRTCEERHEAAALGVQLLTNRSPNQHAHSAADPNHCRCLRCSCRPLQGHLRLPHHVVPELLRHPHLPLPPESATCKPANVTYSCIPRHAAEHVHYSEATSCMKKCGSFWNDSSLLPYTLVSELFPS